MAKMQKKYGYIFYLHYLCKIKANMNPKKEFFRKHIVL